VIHGKKNCLDCYPCHFAYILRYIVDTRFGHQNHVFSPPRRTIGPALNAYFLIRIVRIRRRPLILLWQAVSPTSIGLLGPFQKQPLTNQRDITHFKVPQHFTLAVRRFPRVAESANHVHLPNSAPLPGVAGVQFSRPKCLETHDITYIHTTNQKKAKYSMKNAIRSFCQRRRKPKSRLCGPNASRFLSRTNTQLCKDIEKDCWSLLMKFAFPNHALAARKSRKTSEF
jgi:hypothetical protein